MKPKYVIIIILLCFFSCQKEKKHNKIQSSVPKKEILDKDSIPISFLLKNSKKLFLSKILNDKELKKEIVTANENQIEVEYKEIKLEKDLVLCQLIIQEDIEYDYLFRDNKIIYKSTTPRKRVYFYYEYKDWNYDNKPELITYYKEWEGGANLGYHKTQSIYEIKSDTLLNIAHLNIEDVFCQNGITSYITKYEYKYDKKKNELNTKKIIGKGDCDQYIIKKTESVSHKTYKLKKHNNVFDM